MCILVLAIRASERWPLLLVANRDESHDRASAPLHDWDEPPGILAGRDLVSGGTWLGVSRHGRLCAVTNRRGFGPPNPIAPSRGRLVAEVLRGADPRGEDLRQFSPVSLVFSDAASALFRTNRPDLEDVAMDAGLHGLANGPLEEPAPKVTQLKAAVSQWIEADDAGFQPLFAALRDESLASGQSPSDAVFVRNSLYGSRCSTVVAVDRHGRGRIIERRFDREGADMGQTELGFVWEQT